MVGASFSDGGNEVIYLDYSGGGLKSHGNYMVTSDSSPLSEYTTWGYWEIAYVEPGTGKDYHLHVPGSMWISGVQTIATAVDSLIASNFTGAYIGKAEGVQFDSTSQMSMLYNGQTNLLIKFGAAEPTPVTGTISFDQVSLPVTSAASTLNSSGFTAFIPNVQSSINGAFYGPGANAVGGNFSAKMPDGMQYHGIFAGDLQ